VATRPAEVDRTRRTSQYRLPTSPVATWVRVVAVVVVVVEEADGLPQAAASRASPARATAAAPVGHLLSVVVSRDIGTP